MQAIKSLKSIGVLGLKECKEALDGIAIRGETLDNWSESKFQLRVDEEVAKEEYDNALLKKQKTDRKWDEYDKKKWRLRITGVAIYALNIIDAFWVIKNDRKKNIEKEQRSFSLEIKSDSDKVLVSLNYRF